MGYVCGYEKLTYDFAQPVLRLYSRVDLGLKEDLDTLKGTPGARIAIGAKV